MSETLPDFLKIAAYGRWGTGKTRQIGMLCDAFGADKVYIISADQGLNSIAGKFLPENRIEVDSYDSYREAGNKLIVETIRGNVDRNVWVCVDGFSRVCGWLASKMLNEADQYGTQRAMGVLHEAITDARLKPYKRFANAEGVIDNQKIYGPIGTEIVQRINGFMRADANIYVTLGEDETTRDRTAGPPYIPDLPGKMGTKELMRTFDYVFRMTLSDGLPLMQIDPDKVNFYWSRTRDNREVTGKIPGETKNFRLDDFVTRLRGTGWPKN